MVEPVETSVGASSGDSKAPGHADPVTAARSLRDALQERAAQCEAERRVPEASIAAMRELGLFKVGFPRRSGGEGHRLETLFQVTAELAKGCMSTAWVQNLLSGVTASAASLPAPARDKIFVTGEELVCGVLMMTGVARVVDGGYRVSGSWGFASGCLHADWGMGGVKVLDSTGETIDEGYAFMPIGTDGLSIKDTWKVAGVVGSGSNTLIADDLFVPGDLVRRLSEAPPEKALYQIEGAEPRDKWPAGPRLPIGVIAPILGAAEAMLEIVAGDFKKRGVSYWRYEKQADSAVLLNELGLAGIEIDSAWLHVRRVAAMMDETAVARPLTPFEKARVQTDCGYAVKLLRSAVGRLMDIAGASGFASANPLQRYWRDINLGSRHAFLNSTMSTELYGRHLADAPSNSDYF